MRRKGKKEEQGEQLRIEEVRGQKERLLFDLTYLEHYYCDPDTHQAAAMKSCSDVE